MEGDLIVGFGDMDTGIGYLNHLFVHKDCQGQGIATALCDELLKRSQKIRIYTHASMTARSFFENRDYYLVKEQEVEIRGILLKNNVMEKVIM